MAYELRRLVVMNCVIVRALSNRGGRWPNHGVGGAKYAAEATSLCMTGYISRCNSIDAGSTGSGTGNETSVDVHTHRLPRVGANVGVGVGTPNLTRHQKLKLQLEARGSLIPNTLVDMASDESFKSAAENLKKLGQEALTKEERRQRQRALDGFGLPSFEEKVSSVSKSSCTTQLSPSNTILTRRKTEILQLNVGLYCNQACGHCHVESSPKRTELMSMEVANRCIHLIQESSSIHTVDITGGAPELCPVFQPLVEASSLLGKDVIVRANLTALLEPEQTATPAFLARHGVIVTASLPCYSAKNVNLQRGRGVFAKSIAALTILNDLGYGIPGSNLKLNLVYNPLGAFLPPNQEKLEQKYKEELWREFGISFNNLFCLTNLPVKRFADFLSRRGEIKDYMKLLVDNFNPDTLEHLMCRNLVSVSWDGSIYECDVNQQLAIKMLNEGGKETEDVLTVFNLDNIDDLTGRSITNDNHCFGCTAGKGSS